MLQIILFVQHQLIIYCAPDYSYLCGINSHIVCSRLSNLYSIILHIVCSRLSYLRGTNSSYIVLQVTLSARHQFIRHCAPSYLIYAALSHIQCAPDCPIYVASSYTVFQTILFVRHYFTYSVLQVILSVRHHFKQSQL